MHNIVSCYDTLIAKAGQTKFAVYRHKVFNFACRRAVIIQISYWWNELDGNAQAHDRVGHTLQLECLRLRSGMGSRTLYMYSITIRNMKIFEKV